MMDYAHVVSELEAQFLAQLDREPPEANATVAGDAAVKQKLYGLLGRAQLRRFFSLAVDHGNLGRIRGLFGAPPYFFVGAGEGLLLRAGGFAARTHMAGASPIPNFSQMVPQFVDQHDRGLSLAHDELTEWPEPRSGSFFFRLRSKRAPAFRVGELLTVAPTPMLAAVAKKYGQSEEEARAASWELKVERIRPRLEDAVGASGMISLVAV